MFHKILLVKLCVQYPQKTEAFKQSFSSHAADSTRKKVFV